MSFFKESGVWWNDAAPAYPDLIDGHRGPWITVLELRALAVEESLLALFEGHVNSVNSCRRGKHLVYFM